MGTDLVPIGNHKVKFKERNFKEIATEITDTLNKITFVNAEYLRVYALYCKSNYVRTVREIKTKKEWTYREESEYYNLQEDGSIDFYGPFDLTIWFTEHYINFLQPGDRYRHWVEIDDFEYHAYRNEWRKYMYQIVHAFGGDRVIYLADNGHTLEEFWSMEVPFEEIEIALKQKLGTPITTFLEMVKRPYESYMIDHFKDINWDFNVPLNEYYPEPDDLTSIDLNLKDFETTEQLIEIDWDDKVLKHKLVDNEVHFAHIVRFKGVIVEHYGMLNGKENHKSYLDKYAPFTFDEIEEKIANKFNDDLTKCYAINFYKCEHRWAWKAATDKFGKVLPWTGNGKFGGGSFGQDESTQYFFAVDVQIAIDLLILIGKKFNVTAPIEIVRRNEFEEQKAENKLVIFTR
ncbi:MAG: hypothetical protein LC109_08960 [Bacteroidia bacterium]|nr:hypothetical protein [Bacteroidia bacterium]